MEWDAAAGAYLVHNDSDRPVRVSFSNWVTTLDVLLNPRERRWVNIVEFEAPYTATYVD